VDVAFKAKKKL